MEPFDPNHLRKLAGLPLNESVQYEHLEESVSDDPAINQLIDQNLAHLDVPEQSKYLDALEALQNAGRTGMTGQQWMAAYRAVRGTNEDDTDVVKTCARLFMGTTIEKVGLNYVWNIDGVSYQDDAETPDPLSAAVGGHVDLTYELLAYCRTMETVNIRSLSRIVSNRTRMDPTSAQQIALNFLDAHRGMFTSIGDGEYEVNDLDARKPPGSTNYSQMFRDIASAAKPEQDR